MQIDAPAAAPIDEEIGSAVAQALTSVAAAVSGSPLLAAIPALFGYLSSGRQARRTKEALEDLDARIRSLARHQDEITDAQLKLLMEVVLTITRTVDSQKIERLKNAAFNAMSFPELTQSSVEIVTRTLRDISPAEICFLVQNSGQMRVSFGSPVEFFKDTSWLERSDDLETAAEGLLNLGLLSRSPNGPLGDPGGYVFTPLSRRIISLIS